MILPLNTYLEMCGLNVIEVAGWETRKSSNLPFTPVGVMVHHTAGVDSLQRCISRNLVQFLIPKPEDDEKESPVYLISQNRTGHPGTGLKAVLDRVKNGLAPLGDANTVYPGARDDIAGYQWYWGIEVENLGDGKDPYPVGQLTAMLKLCAALCRVHGWGPERVIHHREWTRRKIDMSWRETFGFNVRDWTALHLFLLENHWKQLNEFFASLGGPDQLEQPEGIDGGR